MSTGFATNRVMTTKEVAKALGVSERAVRGHAQKMGLTRNGVQTLITQYQATEIKKALSNSGRKDLANVCQLENVSTELEENEIVMRALSILKRNRDEYKQRAEIAETKCIELQPKADYADKALKTTTQMSITDAGKILEIRQSDMFKFLHYEKLLTSKNLPTQKAIDLKMLTLRKYVINETDTKKTACMTDSNLSNFIYHYIRTNEFYAWNCSR